MYQTSILSKYLVFKENFIYSKLRENYINKDKTFGKASCYILETFAFQRQQIMIEELVFYSRQLEKYYILIYTSI